MARWQRAEHLLSLPAGSRILDLGCAFGHGTARLARRYHVEGIDPSSAYIARARRRHPNIHFQIGQAQALPYADASFDAVVMLDVLEHLPSGTECRALAEVSRVLRPGGLCVLSTPNRGLLARLDSLNIYLSLRGGDADLARVYALNGNPPRHRHYSAAQLRDLLAPHNLVVDRCAYSGIGVAEIVNIILLVLLWRPPIVRPLYNLLQYLYFGVYIAEDIIPMGWFSYHLMVVAHRLDGIGSCSRPSDSL